MKATCLIGALVCAIMCLVGISPRIWLLIIGSWIGYLDYGLERFEICTGEIHRFSVQIRSISYHCFWTKCIYLLNLPRKFLFDHSDIQWSHLSVFSFWYSSSGRPSLFLIRCGVTCCLHWKCFQGLLRRDTRIFGDSGTLSEETVRIRTLNCIGNMELLSGWVPISLACRTQIWSTQSSRPRLCGKRYGVTTISTHRSSLYPFHLEMTH